MTSQRLDFRLAPAAICAWIGCAIAVTLSPAKVLMAAGVFAVLALLVLRRTHQRGRSTGTAVVAITLVVGSAALAVAGLRSEAIQAGPLPELARERAQVSAVATVLTDPALRQGSFGEYVVVRVRVLLVSGRGSVTELRAPILVIAEPTWRDVRLGDTIRFDGRLSAAQESDVAAVLTTRRPPSHVEAAPWWLRGVAAVRAGVRTAHEPLPEGPRALIPALVDGDDVGMPEDLEHDFRTTGLTHLLAVSGTNLTLVLGFVMLVARWVGVRGWGFAIVGLISVVFFVLLARPEPSVLRAAAMGVVALAGLSSGGRRRGLRALCSAIVALVLVDPWLARSPGFVLSALATAGILVLAPVWREALSRWIPRWLAEAIAVPLAAQISCTPVVAALSGEVSLVAIASNLLVAPAVGPATVIGLMSGLVAVVIEPLGQIGGRLAGVPAWWIVVVAQRSARLDGASVAWPVGPLGMVTLVALCVLVILTMRHLLRRALPCLAVAALLAILVVRPGGRMGWPPPGWLMVMCDVGQGDTVVLNAAPGVGIVVDAGPDSHDADACLDDLGVEHVALVVLTHFHADHVDGLPGVLDGRDVAELSVSPLSEPPDRAVAVSALARRASARVVVDAVGDRRVIGQVTLDFLGPRRVSAGDANDASLVIAAAVADRDILLTGDAEPAAQADLLDSGVDLDTEILKVPHHGSANVDPEFLAATHPDIAVVSAGVDNDYGHPTPHLLALLEDLGVPVYRTDRDGDIAIVESDGQLGVVTQK